MPDPPNNVETSERFNAGDADVTFRSSNNVLFHIHTANLTRATGGFPPAFSPKSSESEDSEIVDLSESSETLELLFQFVYPQRQPSLDDLPFSQLAPLAEAAEKYQVYPAMQVCSAFMSKGFPEHAIEVLGYAFKHDYPSLMNKAALCISPENMSSVCDQVNPRVLQAWVRYETRQLLALRKIFLVWTKMHDKGTGLMCDAWPRKSLDILFSLGSGLIGMSLDLQPAVLAALKPANNEKLCCRNALEKWETYTLAILEEAGVYSQSLAT